MLYRPMPFDFSHDVLVIVHIPKTGGNSLSEAIFDRLGQENCLVVDSAEKAGKIQPSRLHKAAWSAKEALRKAKFWARGGAPRMGDRDSRAELERVFAFDGHYALGREPRNSRKPVYVTAVRDPVDRFLSNYYMAHDNRAQWPPGQRDRHPFWAYDLDRFVDYVYARRSWNDTNIECRFIGGVGRFEPARRAVDERIFLAVPTNRLDDGVALLQPVFDLRLPLAPRSNVGKARQGKAPPSSEALAKIRQMTSEDRLLFDYVSRVFDDLYREATGKPRGA
jgi:hypothetical protein